jgi:hypothetical protein
MFKTFGPGVVAALEGAAASYAITWSTSARVTAERAAGKDADVIVASLGPKVRAEYPDWAAPELIDFAIRYYSTLS